MDKPPSPSPSKEEADSDKKMAILIQRKTKKTQNELSIGYDTEIVEKIIQNDEERSNILKLVKNILLSCNITYIVYVASKIFGYLKSLFISNIFYFLIINYFFSWLNKEKGKGKNKNKNKEIKVSLWKRLILFNLPELLIIFLYHKKKLNKKGRSIFLLFAYLSERISYLFNTNSTNNYLCQIDQRNYDIYLIKKEEDPKKNDEKIYLTNEELLSKDTFFDSVISYPNANFEDFDFNNLDKNEEDLFYNIFDLINDIEKKIKEENKFLKNISIFIGNLSYSFSTNYYVLYAMLLKIAGFLINEIILNNHDKSKRNILIKEKAKEFNHKNMDKGYFLGLNEDVILLFRIKDKYKSFDESYSILYEDCQNLFKHFFK